MFYVTFWASLLSEFYVKLFPDSIIWSLENKISFQDVKINLKRYKLSICSWNILQEITISLF